MSSDASTDKLAALELAYKQVTGERDRLRDARAFFARQLGPLPAFAGISAAVVAAFSDKIQHNWCLYVALALLGMVVVLSFLYSRVTPYRELRVQKEKKWRADLEPASDGGLQPEDRLPKDEWYRFQISVERDVYGSLPQGKGERPSRRRLLPTRGVTNLQEALDRERAGLFLAQFVFLLAIGFLLAGRL